MHSYLGKKIGVRNDDSKVDVDRRDEAGLELELAEFNGLYPVQGEDQVLEIALRHWTRLL